jgi:hypothetical protein
VYDTRHDAELRHAFLSVSLCVKGELAQILDFAWFWSKTQVPERDAVVSALREAFPSAIPVRFGPGDPPAHRMDGDAPRFAELWDRAREDAWLLNWTGRRTHMTFSFPKRRANPDGPAVASLEVSVDAAEFAGRPDDAVQRFTTMAAALRPFFAAVYPLRGWSFRGGVLFLDTGVGETSPLRRDGVWVGIPTRDPWLMWLGEAYARLLRNDTIAKRTDGTVLIRTSVHPFDESRSPAPVPRELRATVHDPRFPGLPASVPAPVIPPEL